MLSVDIGGRRKWLQQRRANTVKLQNLKTEVPSIAHFPVPAPCCHFTKMQKGNTNTCAQEGCCRGEARRLLVSQSGAPRAVGSAPRPSLRLRSAHRSRGPGSKGGYSHRIHHQPEASNTVASRRPAQGTLGACTRGRGRSDRPGRLALPRAVPGTPLLPRTRSRGFVGNTTPVPHPVGRRLGPGLPSGSPREACRPRGRARPRHATARPPPRGALLDAASPSLRPPSSSRQETALGAGKGPVLTALLWPGSEPCELHCLKNPLYLLSPCGHIKGLLGGTFPAKTTPRGCRGPRRLRALSLFPGPGKAE